MFFIRKKFLRLLDTDYEYEVSRKQDDDVPPTLRTMSSSFILIIVKASVKNVGSSYHRLIVRFELCLLKMFYLLELNVGEKYRPSNL